MPRPQGLRALVASSRTDDQVATPPAPTRLLNMKEARELVPKKDDGTDWSKWWMLNVCAPEAKVRFGGRVFWREAGLRAWLATFTGGAP